ncbi:serine/threonine-protein kinase [Streptomyces sp. NPDC057362]|uniref:serine/threonine-protein kinase n=1 Tax=Streptomyces sp. NPDC057362 TaxID=3346106 RepID=UPI00363034FA
MTLQQDDPRSVGGYVLEGRLGAGGMGVVYLARSLSGRQVAVKVIRPELAHDPGFRDRFRREVDAARQVSGAFTAPVVDADAESPTPWLATLFVPGPSLAERVAGHGPLPPGEVLRLAAGLAEALRDIHRVGLVHRDLKPGNILLAEDGPRVIDFGISRARDATQLTRTGAAIGTPPFMAPEQFTGAQVGPAADVFSLGSVLVHAATGHGPFDGDSMHTVGFRVVYEEPDLTALPDQLRPLVTSCLAKEPAHRPTVDQVLHMLGAAARSAPDPRAAPPAITNAPASTHVPDASDHRRQVPGAPFPVDRPPTVPDADSRRSPGRTARHRVVIAAASLAAVAVTVPVLVSKVGNGGTGTGKHTGPSPTVTATASQIAGPTANTSCPARSGLLRGAGSQTQQKAVNGWIRDHTEACPGQDIVYDGGGSGFGYMDFKGKRADFAVLNEPMTATQTTWADRRCGEGGALQIPIVTTPVAFVFHLEGVDALTLSARTVAQIYTGEITRWNDAKIAGLNPGVPLPDRKITLFGHHGQSPATLVLTHYLTDVAPDYWPYRPSNVLDVKTGEAVPEQDIAERVTATDGSLSYAPMDMVSAAGLSPAHLDTGADEPVFPDTESLTKGAATATVTKPDSRDMAMTLNHGTTAEDAYPLFRFGYAVLCARPGTPTSPDARPFLSHALSDKGRKTATELGYGPLPADLAKKGRDLLSQGG